MIPFDRNGILWTRYLQANGYTFLALQKTYGGRLVALGEYEWIAVFETPEAETIFLLKHG